MHDLRFLQGVYYGLLSVGSENCQQRFCTFGTVLQYHVHLLDPVQKFNLPHFMQPIHVIPQLVDHNLAILQPNVHQITPDLEGNSLLIEHLMTDNLKVLQRVHNELPVRNTGNRFIP